MMADTGSVIDALTSEIHRTAAEKGFWEFPQEAPEWMIVAVKVALIHSEPSEALEQARLTQIDHAKVIEELADTIIRCLDLARYIEWIAPATSDAKTIGRSLTDKVEANRERPYKHGKSF